LVNRAGKKKVFMIRDVPISDDEKILEFLKSFIPNEALGYKEIPNGEF